VKQILEEQSKAAKTKGKKTAKKSIHVTEKNLDKFLGVRQYSFHERDTEAQVGLVNGLAWTEVGGDILQIEATVLDGKGKMISTGKLGDVMQESIQAASSYVRRRVEELGIDPKFYENKDIHIHVPDGATPKDGPSAGLAMVTAMVSALTGIPIRHDVAMTGEVSLRGRALQIGGLKEKLLAALRGGVKTVFIPADNEKDLAEMPKNIIDGLKIIPVEHVDNILPHALTKAPKPKKKAPAKAKKPASRHTSSGEALNA
jgi:ATP-dependent Lon protease